MAGISRTTTEFRWVDFTAPDFVPNTVESSNLIFHTATLVGKWIYVFGPMGRVKTSTEQVVCRLDTETEAWEWMHIEGPYVQFRKWVDQADAIYCS